jgi:hypothetical protein
VVGGGAAIVVNTSLGPKMLKRIGFIGADTKQSPQDPSSLCLEYTQPDGNPAPCWGGGTDTNGEFWLFFTISAVPAGSYKAYVTQNTDGTTTGTVFTTSSSPFKLQNSSAVNVTVGGSPAACPSSAPSGGTDSGTDPVDVTVPAGPAQDVQVAVHLRFNGTAPITVYFNAQLTDPSNTVYYAQPTTISVHNPC